jgi:hypothetical protein
VLKGGWCYFFKEGFWAPQLRLEPRNYGWEGDLFALDIVHASSYCVFVFVCAYDDIIIPAWSNYNNKCCHNLNCPFSRHTYLSIYFVKTVRCCLLLLLIMRPNEASCRVIRSSRLSCTQGR